MSTLHPVAPAPRTIAVGEPFDCLSCGACCRRATDGCILIPVEDLLRWHRIGRSDIALQTQPGHFGSEAYASRPDGGCVHLGIPDQPYGCGIYADRGTTCSDFERGSPQCVAYRREFGVAP